MMNKKNYTEEELDFYVRFPDRLTDEERKKIEEYVSGNALAKEFVALQRKLYSDIDREMKNPPSQADVELADSLLRKKQFFLPSLGIIRAEKKQIVNPPFEIINERRAPLPVRFAWYVKRNPIRSVGMGFAGLALCALLLFTILPTSKTGNPTFGEVKDNLLTIYDESGQALWTKPAVGTPDFRVSSDYYSEYNRSFLIADIDGDGSNEVLTNLYNEKFLSESSTNTLTCYSNNGTEIWRYSFALDFSEVENGRMHSTHTWIRDFAVIPQEGSTKPRIFVVLSDPNPYPSCIIEIDPIQKKEIQTYWHVGHISKLFASDINGDGKKELLFNGINNFENAAFVSALQPDDISGATSVAFNEFMNGERVQEIFYCLFPPTALRSLFGNVHYNEPVRFEPFENENIFKVETSELQSINKGGIIYTLNRSLEVVSIVPNSGFQKVYDETRKSGHPELEPLSAGYYEKLKHNVRYWDGEKFVNYPTFNKKYMGKQPLP